MFAEACGEEPFFMPRAKPTPSKRARVGEGKVWATVHVKEALTASGGEGRGAVPLEPHQFPRLHPGARYLKMNKGEPWLMALAIGKVGRQEFLSRDTFVNMLKDKAYAALPAEVKEMGLMLRPLSQDAAGPEEGERDPMSYMTDDAEGRAVLADSPPKASAGAGAPCPVMVQVELPEECAVLHPSATATRTLSVIIHRSNRTTLFVNLNDLDWIDRMVHDYWVCGNVALTEEETKEKVDKFGAAGRPCSRHE